MINNNGASQLATQHYLLCVLFGMVTIFVHVRASMTQIHLIEFGCLLTIQMNKERNDRCWCAVSTHTKSAFQRVRTHTQILMSKLNHKWITNEQKKTTNQPNTEQTNFEWSKWKKYVFINISMNKRLTGNNNNNNKNSNSYSSNHEKRATRVCTRYSCKNGKQCTHYYYNIMGFMK